MSRNTTGSERKTMYSVAIISRDEGGMKVMYDCISTVEQAKILAQCALRKRSNPGEIVCIFPPYENDFDWDDSVTQLAKEHLPDHDRSDFEPFERVKKLEEEIEDIHKAYVNLHKLLG